MPNGKSTPGPWRFGAHLSASENHHGFWVAGGGYGIVNEVFPLDEDAQEGEANARLIAAAPELLAELQAFVAFIDPEGARTAQEGGPYTERLLAARAAIAKATGESADVR